MIPDYDIEGHALRDLLVDLVGDDEERSVSAGKMIALTEMSLLQLRSESATGQVREFAEFSEAVRAVLAESSFSANALVPHLLGIVRSHPSPEACALSLAQLLRGSGYREIARCAAAGALLRNAGTSAMSVLPTLIEMIEKEPEGGHARLAADVIASIGSEAAAATDALFRGLCVAGDEYDLETAEKTIWNAFVRALAPIAEGDSAVLQRVIDLARSEQDGGRLGAIATLHELGPRAIVATPVLVELVDDDEAGLEALVALEKIDPDDTAGINGALFARLSTCAEDVRQPLVKRLRRCGWHDGAIATEISKAPLDPSGDDDDDDECPEMFLSAGSSKKVPVDLDRPLAQLVRDLVAEDRATRRVAANTLIELSFGSPARDDATRADNERRFREELATLFQDRAYPVSEVLGDISRCYGELLRDDKRRVVKAKNLGRMSWSETHYVSVAMRVVIANCGPGGEAVLSELAGLLRADSVSGELSHVAVEAMNSIGPAARANMDALLDNVLTFGVREWPNERVAYIKEHGLSTAQLGCVIQSAEQGSAEGRSAALNVLAALGTRAAMARNVLLGALQDSDSYIRAEAIAALAAVAGRDPEIAGMLLERSHDCEIVVRLEAARAMGDVSEPSDVVVERLLEMTRDGEWMLRGEAIRSLGKLRHRVDDVLAIAMALLDDTVGEDYSVSDRAVEALGSLGALAASAVPRLMEMLEDEQGVRFVIVNALGSIGPAAAAALDRLRTLRMYPTSQREEIDQAIRLIRVAPPA